MFKKGSGPMLYFANGVHADVEHHVRADELAREVRAPKAKSATPKPKGRGKCKCNS